MESARTRLVLDKDIEDLIPEYLDNRRSDIIIIRSAVGSGDIEIVRFLGHRMKGSGRGYGFGKITDIGGEIEWAARMNDSKRILAAVEALESYVNSLELSFE